MRSQNISPWVTSAGYHDRRDEEGGTEQPGVELPCAVGAAKAEGSDILVSPVPPAGRRLEQAGAEEEDSVPVHRHRDRPDHGCRGQQPRGAQKAVVMRTVISSAVALTVRKRSAVIPRVTWASNQGTKPGLYNQEPSAELIG